MNFTQLSVGQMLTSFFEYKGQKYLYTIENIGIDTDFNDTDDIFRLSFPFAKYSQEFEAKDIPEAVTSLTDFVDYAENHAEERKIISFRIPLSVLENLKKIAKKDGLPYQTLMNSVLHQYVESRK